jgi:hypothetical protein
MYVRRDVSTYMMSYVGCVYTRVYVTVCVYVKHVEQHKNSVQEYVRAQGTRTTEVTGSSILVSLDPHICHFKCGLTGNFGPA